VTKSFILAAVGAIAVNPAMAAVDADYYSSGNRINDADYIYLSDGYACGENDGADNYFYPDPYTTLYTGETLWDTKKGELLLCCEDTNYWVSFGNTSSIPAVPCETRYNWVDLGGHRYCRAQQVANYDWCMDLHGSGVIPSSDAGACEYSAGTCGTFTHCEKGYYKDGASCKECPNGGTTDGYTDNGIAACYLPAGTVTSDATGTFAISGGNCMW